jgi:hypothetical protein
MRNASSSRVAALLPAEANGAPFSSTAFHAWSNALTKIWTSSASKAPVGACFAKIGSMIHHGCRLRHGIEIEPRSQCVPGTFLWIESFTRQWAGLRGATMRVLPEEVLVRQAVAQGIGQALRDVQSEQHFEVFPHSLSKLVERLDLPARSQIERLEHQ